MAGALLWFALGFFAVMVVCRVIQFASMPMHLRWELYPMPLDPKHHYGGSYMEEVDYVRKPRQHVKLNGLREMAAEVFLLKRVREHNRFGLWPFSMAMHWGVYLLFFWLILLAVESLGGRNGLAAFTNAIGAASWVLGAVGTLGLMLRRAACPELAAYTAPVDYLHLLFLFGIFATGLAGWFTGPAYFEAVRRLANGALSPGDLPVAGSAWASAHLVLFALFLIYMPFSRLFHYAAKYFTIDKVLWDDLLNARGSEIERRVTSQLRYRLTWSGRHIAPGQSWAQEVTITDAREGKA
ncbi:MAG: respiratory nitrate reductase subunit gamma [Bacillota bacterium]